MKPVIYVFDFDGTLTRHDSFIEFIRFVHGTRRLLWGLLRFLPLLVLMCLRLYPNWKSKQRVFAYFFKGMDYEVFFEFCEEFAHTQRVRLLRPKASVLMHRLAETEAETYIVTASIDQWVRPFFPYAKVIGTKAETDHADKLTGRFLTPNCYGPEKVRRLGGVVNYLDRYVVAFGDSRGDRELLALANESYYKPFRR